MGWVHDITSFLYVSLWLIIIFGRRITGHCRDILQPQEPTMKTCPPLFLLLGFSRKTRLLAEVLVVDDVTDMELRKVSAFKSTFAIICIKKEKEAVVVAVLRSKWWLTILSWGFLSQSCRSCDHIHFVKSWTKQIPCYYKPICKFQHLSASLPKGLRRQWSAHLYSAEVWASLCAHGVMHNSTLSDIE